MTVGPRARLPLFPLSSVLFPGLVLPLHVFEDRYRRLVRELLTHPEGSRRFGIVAIRGGVEAGGGTPELYDVGCTAELRRVEPLADGRFNLVTVGGTRFRLHDVDPSRPYLVGDVEELPDDVGDPDAASTLATRMHGLFTTYLAALGALRDAGEGAGATPEIPLDDPILLSHLVPAVAVLDLADKQRLLAEPDAVSRLRSGTTVLRRELAIIEWLHAIPAPELLQLPRSAN